MNAHWRALFLTLTGVGTLVVTPHIAQGFLAHVAATSVFVSAACMGFADVAHDRAMLVGRHVIRSASRWYLLSVLCTVVAIAFWTTVVY